MKKFAVPRSCPYCQTVIPINEGFSFDEELNLICESCKNVAFPVSQKKEKSLIENTEDLQN